MFATESGALLTMEILLQRGAAIGLIDDQKRSCLHLACRGGHKKIIPLIFQVIKRLP